MKVWNPGGIVRAFFKNNSYTVKQGENNVTDEVGNYLINNRFVFVLCH